ncbi:ABC transporter permease [candidate division KSB3 bacterium]|uniref:ABC transporter permease n=1 Tax=candidate division KSB3 bacterium TaxID=2044937 RepID=A0A2G6KCR8_9BACT|nr:MAG: ABC transporter permease [candidate division KSB3 bacterium]
MTQHINLKKERAVWIGSCVLLVLLSLFPFSSQQGSLLTVFRHGNFTSTIWNLLGDMPLLGLLLAIVFINIGLAIVQMAHERQKSYLFLGVNLLGILLFIIQFVALRPDVPLGFGSFLLFFGLLFTLARALSRLGLIMGDAFISGSILSISILLVIFILLPLFVILGRSVIVTSFELTEASLQDLKHEGIPHDVWNGLQHLKDQKVYTSKAFWKAVEKDIGRDQTIKYKDSILKHTHVAKRVFRLSNFTATLRAYPSTWRILKNSIMMASSVGFLSTLIGLSFALVIERSRFKYKRFMQGFSLLPIITPPFVVGLAIIFMLGRTGYLSYGIFKVRSSFIFGYPGIVLAQTLSFAPMAYLILAGVVRSLDSALEEASYTMGANRWYTFRRVIWPLIRPGVANAFLISVIESLADFANPILLGGDFDVLSTSIYLAIIGRYDEVLAASLGIVLLSITLTTFLVQRYWVGKRSYVTITGKPSRRTPLPLPKGLDYSMLGLSLVWVVLTMTLYGSVFLGGFVKLWGINNSLTLMHYKRFLVDGFESYITTIKLAALSAPLTAVLGLLIAYLVSRYHFFGKGTFEFTSMLSFAIPGTVVGIGYVMSFNTAPLLFTGTAAILVICFIFRNMPVGIRSAMAALQQIDRALEEASITLGASNFRTFHKIVLPLIRPAVFSGLVFSFVRAMTAISAVIFLVTARTKLSTTVILGRIEAGKLGLATAYCTLMILTMIVAIVFMHVIVQRMTGVGKTQTLS